MVDDPRKPGSSKAAAGKRGGGLSSPQINPPPRSRPGMALSPAGPDRAASGQAGSKRGGTGKAMRGKRQPTGDYVIGYARPPVEHRFKTGNPGGPGRPAGKRSQNTILRAELDSKMVATIEGKRRKVSKRELASRMLMNKVFETGNPKLLFQVVAMAQHLFPDPVAGEEADMTPLLSASEHDYIERLLTDMGLGAAPVIRRASGDTGTGE